ncbi:MAG: hypothetical protein AB7F35_25385 [Acetobacteraceae bacterium]
MLLRSVSSRSGLAWRPGVCLALTILLGTDPGWTAPALPQPVSDAASSDAASPGTDGNGRVAALITRIEEQVQAGRMVAPVDDNAMNTVGTLIALVPIVATSDLQLIRQIPARFAGRADAAEAAGQHAQAQHFRLLARAFEAKAPDAGTDEGVDDTGPHLPPTGRPASALPVQPLPPEAAEPLGRTNDATPDAVPGAVPSDLAALALPLPPPPPPLANAGTTTPLPDARPVRRKGKGGKGSRQARKAGRSTQSAAATQDATRGHAAVADIARLPSPADPTATAQR